METSIRLINTCGYDNVTVDNICEACGISKGAFYHHFRSKLDIISENEALVNAAMEDALEFCHDEDIEASLLIFLNAMIDSVEKTGLEFVRQRSKFVLGGDYGKDPPQTSYAVHSRALLRGLLQNAVDSGVLLATTPIDQFLETLMTMLSGLITEWCIFNGAYPITERAWQLCLPLVRALLKPYRRSPSSL